MPVTQQSWLNPVGLPQQTKGPSVYATLVTIPHDTPGVSFADLLPFTSIQYISLQHVSGTGLISMGSCPYIVPSYHFTGNLLTPATLRGQNGWVAGPLTTAGAPPPEIMVIDDPTGYGRGQVITDSVQDGVNLMNIVRPLDVAIPAGVPFSVDFEGWIEGTDAGRELSFGVTQTNAWATYGIGFGLYDNLFAVFTDGVGSATYALAPNQWVSMKIFVDLNNLVTFMINGVVVRAGNIMANLLGMNRVQIISQSTGGPHVTANHPKISRMRVSILPVVTPGTAILPDGTGWERDFYPLLPTANMGMLVDAVVGTDAQFYIMAVGV